MSKKCYIKVYNKEICPYFNIDDRSCSYAFYDATKSLSECNCFMAKDYDNLVNEIKDARNNTTDTKNLMGCSENWYSSFYAISKTFTDEQIDKMSYRELMLLIKLGDRMSEAFY